MLRISFLLAILAAVTQAWLPQDRNLFGNETQDAVSQTVVADIGRRAQNWLPARGKIRGVNLGAFLIIEPWMANAEWSSMGCGGTNSEFDCVMRLGQAEADRRFQAHWASWITENDIAAMSNYGINTIRIPVGYWIMESIVYRDSEHFPRGGLPYLERVCNWASNYGFYIIIDLHGAPGAQVPQQPFTGQFAPSAGFYQGYQYDRAYKFLEFMTNLIHTNNAYRNVGMLEVVNEPEGGHPNLVSEFYPNAYNRIRQREQALGVTSNNYVHVQFMSRNWGAGDPKAGIPGGATAVAFDNHRYLKWDPSVPVSQTGYISTSCRDNVASDNQLPLIVGEWSLSVKTEVEHNAEFQEGNNANYGFYRKWWAAQVIAYEKQWGWVFWSWKAQLNDFRWSYKEAVEKGVIPKNVDEAFGMGVC
ncbi:glycoside hydrolase family 5 protein [Patellaria atrata CBS 101060]|uniref:glucan endo-1,6-beta-glucosidase n=1 Tax=Patellaria atrata CBS 101060 TaxID=1346257 RepID=A0A9P4SA64_9PEZI|nr:glycoside hydrolase family 5 protein [Patellaria atrata CBS 101060]